MPCNISHSTMQHKFVHLRLDDMAYVRYFYRVMTSLRFTRRFLYENCLLCIKCLTWTFDSAFVWHSTVKFVCLAHTSTSEREYTFSVEKMLCLITNILLGYRYKMSTAMSVTMHFTILCICIKCVYGFLKLTNNVPYKYLSSFLCA